MPLSSSLYPSFLEHHCSLHPYRESSKEARMHVWATWHHQELPSTKLSLKSSRKSFQESQSCFLQKYRTNPGRKKSFKWPEIVACEPRRGWKRDKLLPPAAGSFSATEAPANQMLSSQQKLQIISFFRGKVKKQPAIFIPRVGKH